MLQVGYLQELNRDALSTEHKLSGCDAWSMCTTVSAEDVTSTVKIPGTVSIQQQQKYIYI